jgi:hypothetical protein
MDDNTTQSPPSYHVAGLFRAYYLASSGESSPLYGFTNPAHSAAERRSDRISRKIHGLRVDALVQLLHFRGRLTESCLLMKRNNQFPRSGCWLAGSGGFLAGSTNLNPAPIEISCVLGRRRCGGWCPVPVKSAGLSNSRSHAFISLPQQLRLVYPSARPYPGRYHRLNR